MSTNVVKQRLRLAKASPLLLEAYEHDELTLDQLVAFCLIDDAARQEQVYAAIKNQWNKGADAIRRMLTETTVQADDRRARFVGADAYKAAGGVIIRDLFDEDDGGWLQDVPLLERLVAEKLAAAAETVKAEGWGFVEAAVDFPWNHHREYRPLKPIAPALTDAEEEVQQALLNELEALDETGDRCEEEDARRAQVVHDIADLENRSPVFDETQKAQAHVFISLTDEGLLTIDRGWLNRVDDVSEMRGAVSGELPADGRPVHTGSSTDVSTATSPAEEEDATELPDRLMLELTAYHSLALRNALANNAEIAKLALLHALTLRLFYHYTTDSCLQIEAKDALTQPFPGLADFASSTAINTRHRAWEEALPERPEDLWLALCALDADNRDALLAHCVGCTINAVHQPGDRLSGKRRHALQLAEAVQLDMAEAGWTTRPDNYLARITKAQIVEAVRETRGDKTAELLVDLKKKEMALEAERLLAESGWLPEPLRTPVALETPAASLPAFLTEEAASPE